jgi:hypothetical protein
MVIKSTFAFVSTFLILMSTAVPAEPVTSRVDSTTLAGKLILGYQGWFGCPGDVAHRGWRHWFDGKSPTVDMLPDTSELAPDERCASGWSTPGNEPVWLFSSQDSRSVERHFRWMRDYGLDGVALQRFGAGLASADSKASVDRVLASVRAAAEQEGRVFFVMYDLSGMAADKLDSVVEDWAQLEQSHLTASIAYQRHHGHPVLALWGLGFKGRPITSAMATNMIKRLRDESAAYGALTLLGGVPAGWRMRQGDADTDAGWDAVYRSFDIISPWTVGRYADDAGDDSYRRNDLEPDLAETHRLGIDYMPVVFPGFSWANLMRARAQPDKALPNQIPRRCGKFFWHQVYDAVSAGTTMMYGAMFDEVDEGTAMFKVLADHRQLPASPGFVALDADGCALPSDWYLQLAGQATLALKKPGAPDAISPNMPITEPH